MAACQVTVVPPSIGKCVPRSAQPPNQSPASLPPSMPVQRTHPLHMPAGGAAHVVHALAVTRRHGPPRLCPPPLQLRHGCGELAVCEALGRGVHPVARQLSGQLSLQLTLQAGQGRAQDGSNLSQRSPGTQHACRPSACSPDALQEVCTRQAAAGSCKAGDLPPGLGAAPGSCPGSGGSG